MENVELAVVVIVILLLCCIAVVMFTLIWLCSSLGKLSIWIRSKDYDLRNKLKK